jgi:hypothetical protein
MLIVALTLQAAGLGYPTPYADSAQLAAASAEDKHKLYLFNCAQVRWTQRSGMAFSDW